MTVGSITQKNPFITVFIGDFDAKSLKWCTDDKTAQESLNIENFLSQFSLSQVINKPTHVSQKLNFFTDPLFTNQQNLITHKLTLHFIAIAIIK